MKLLRPIGIRARKGNNILKVKIAPGACRRWAHS
jgi:hypothetical protein